jgi:hypothetical protein
MRSKNNPESRTLMGIPMGGNMLRSFRNPAFCWLLIGLTGLLGACSASQKSYSPVRKFSAEDLRKDFSVMQDILEKFHPSLYWYTPKDSMDRVFAQYKAAIRDSMTEQQFGFRILAPVTTQVRCGHTSFSFSKEYTRFFRGLPLPSFPLYLKIWADTMMVIENRDRKDSLIKRGTLIRSINGMQARDLTNTMFRFMPTDGYAENMNYIRLSSAFPYYHRNIFGLSKQYAVGYMDSSGAEKNVLLPLYQPLPDSGRKAPVAKSERKKRSKSSRLREVRSLDIDSPANTAYMDIESFDNGFAMKRFYRRSFRSIKEAGVENLVIDIRNNGGGKVDNYTALARYLKKDPFKVADTAFSLRRNFNGYGRYFQMNEVNWMAMKLFVSRRKDGRNHFRYWENHSFKPRKKNHFDGQLYLVISGPTFSASTLFCNTMKGQPNVKLVGEETGGGAHGNSGLMIPYVTLPVTRMRVRMPLFRVVQYNHPPKNGQGVRPDIYVPPVSTAVARGVDLKMETVKALIQQHNSVARAQ